MTRKRKPARKAEPLKRTADGGIETPFGQVGPFSFVPEAPETPSGEGREEGPPPDLDTPPF